MINTRGSLCLLTIMPKNTATMASSITTLLSAQQKKRAGTIMQLRALKNLSLNVGIKAAYLRKPVSLSK